MSVTSMLQRAEQRFDGGPEPDKLQRLFDGVVEDAVRRARRRRPTGKDIARLDLAHLNLLKAIDDLQQFDDPPPKLPTQPTDAGPRTPWHVWLGKFRFDGPRGRPEQHDWVVVAQLLAIYELALGRSVSATGTSLRPGPTYRFLDAALGFARTLVNGQRESRALATPALDALRKQLPVLRHRIRAARLKFERAYRATG